MIDFWNGPIFNMFLPEKYWIYSSWGLSDWRYLTWSKDGWLKLYHHSLIIRIEKTSHAGEIANCFWCFPLCAGELQMIAAEKSTIPLRGRRGLAQTFQFRRALAEAHSIPIHLEIFKKITIEDAGYHVIFLGREHPFRISTSLWMPLVASGCLWYFNKLRQNVTWPFK